MVKLPGGILSKIFASFAPDNSLAWLQILLSTASSFAQSCPLLQTTNRDEAGRVLG
jgi:hypothetical protein